MSPWLPFARRRPSSRGSTLSGTRTGSSSSSTKETAVSESADRRPLLAPPHPSVLKRLFAIPPVPVKGSDLKAEEKLWQKLLINKYEYTEATRVNELHHLAPRIADLWSFHTVQPLKHETPEQYDHRLREIYAAEKKKAHEAREAAEPLEEATVKLDAQGVNKLNTLKAEARLAEKKVKRLERALRGLRKGVDPYTPGPRYASPSQGAGRQD